MAAISYLDGDGVVYNSNYDRISVYANVQQELNNWLKIDKKKKKKQKRNVSKKYYV